MNKQIVRRFQEFAQASGIELDLEQIDFELLDFFNHPEVELMGPKKIGNHDELSGIHDEDGIPVFDASSGVLCYVSEEKFPAQIFQVEDEENPPFSFANEGNSSAGTNFLFHTGKFIMNNHRTLVNIKSKEVFHSRFAYFSLSKMKEEYGFKRGYIPSQTELSRLKIKVPIPKSSQGLSSFQIQQILVRFIEHGQSAHQRRLDGCAVIRPILDKMERSVVPRTLEKSRGARKLIKEFLQEKGIPLDYEKVEFINEKLSSLVDFKGGHSKYTKEYIGKNPGEYPLLTGKLEENSIGAFIKDFDFEGPIITFNKDNASGSRSIFRNEGEKFAMNSHHVAAQLKSSSKIKSYEYLNFQLNQLLFEGKYGWENVASPANIGVLDVKIPKDLEQFSSHEIQKILAWFFESYLKRVNHNRRVADKLERQIAEYRETYLKLFFKSLKQKAYAD